MYFNEKMWVICDVLDSLMPHEMKDKGARGVPEAVAWALSNGLITEPEYWELRDWLRI